MGKVFSIFRSGTKLPLRGPEAALESQAYDSPHCNIQSLSCRVNIFEYQFFQQIICKVREMGPDVFGSLEISSQQGGLNKTSVEGKAPLAAWMDKQLKNRVEEEALLPPGWRRNPTPNMSLA